MTQATEIRERARARVREIDRNESALAIELFDGNRWFTISLPPNRRVAELQHELLALSLAAFAESEAALARKQDDALIQAATELLDAMETCHICKGAMILQEHPVHCEDCSSDCEDHEGPECTPINVLFNKLRKLIHERNLAETGGTK